MSEKNPVISIAMLSGLRKLFDYTVPQGFDFNKLLPGMRVLVPFKNKQKIALIAGLKKSSVIASNKLKSIIDVLDDEPVLPSDVLHLCQWTADYYHASLGDIFLTALPKNLRVVRKTGSRGQKLDQSGERLPPASQLNLSQEQEVALQEILQAENNFKAFLLDGVTGSGKTEVYLQAIEHFIADGKQALILVPEINLTPQTISRFRERFAVSVVALHSALADGERYRAWLSAKSGAAKVIIGTRSAIFTPCKNLAVIIIDEEHDASFKQQDRTRYNARDLALVRAKFNNIPIILGSATPSLESYLNVERTRYQSLIMEKRAGNASLPNYQIIDLNLHAIEDGLSEPIKRAIQNHLETGNQVLIFLNRRGYAPILYCTHCQNIMQCKRCDTRLVFHKQPLRLQCHLCDAVIAIPNKCATCNENGLEPIGLGTQRLEKNLSAYFKNIPIIRIDRDNTKKKGSINELLQQIHSGEPAILLGTQMIAKGHHFSNVTLTCIVDIDSAFLSADFRALEQTAQLIMQVGGRAGRENKPGSVMLQTRNPEHPLLLTLLQNNYRSFAKQLLQDRLSAFLPPHAYCALFKAEAYDVLKAKKFLQDLKDENDVHSHEINIFGPFTPLTAKKKGLHAQHLLVKAKQRKELQTFLQKTIAKLDANKHQAKWYVDVDPLEF